MKGSSKREKISASGPIETKNYDLKKKCLYPIYLLQQVKVPKKTKFILGKEKKKGNEDLC